jgi:uncharacterized spore protein YtfJ
MSEVTDEIRTTVDELLKVVSTKNVVSDPLTVDDKIILTITKIGLGFGTGKGESKSGNGPAGAGYGAGGAVGVSPIALVIINKSITGPGGVEVKPLTPPSGIGRAIGDVASTIVQGMAEAKSKKQSSPQPDHQENMEKI